MGTKVYDNYEDLITFNRNSKGTALRPIGYGDELVVNGTFDTDVSGWDGGGADQSSTAFDNGTIKVFGNTFEYQGITTEVGKVYAASVEITATSLNTPKFRLGTTINGTDNFESSGLEVGSYTFYFVATATTTFVTLKTNYVVGDLTKSTNFDNISVKEVLFDRDGDPLTLFLHPAGVPRIEYDADRNLKGLLIEPTAQNLFTQSDGSNWVQNTTGAEVTMTLNAGTSPDGTTNATGIKSISGNTVCKLRGPSAERSFTSGTFSIYAKSDGRDFVFLNNRSAGGVKIAWFDLVNGTVGTVQAGNTASILSVGNGWYRCSIYRATAIDEIEIGIADTDGSITITDDDTIGLLLYGLQMEQGSPIATSYMPSAGSSFTRDKDDALMTNVSGLIGQKEGTLYVEVDWRETSGVNQHLLEVSDGTNSNRILIYNSASVQLRMIAKANNNLEADQGVSSSGYSGIQKIAFAYKTDDFELYRNGSSIVTDTSGSLAALATLTDIDLGQRNNTGEQANMHIRAVQIIPRRLSDAQLIELTS